MQTKTILIIDDEPGAHEFIRPFLEDRGYCVLSALNGADAINIIKDSKPDLSFLDVKMQGMSGLDVLSKLKEDGIKAKIILMTGLEEGDEINSARALGILDVIKKPVHLPELSELIKKYA